MWEVRRFDPLFLVPAVRAWFRYQCVGKLVLRFLIFGGTFFQRLGATDIEEKKENPSWWHTGWKKPAYAQRFPLGYLRSAVSWRQLRQFFLRGVCFSMDSMISTVVPPSGRLYTVYTRLALVDQGNWCSKLLNPTCFWRTLHFPG